MEYALIVDIACCGSDCCDQLNNPILSEFRIIDHNWNVIKSISHKIIPNDPITTEATLLTGVTANEMKTDSSAIGLETYLAKAYHIMDVSMRKGMFLVGFNHTNYDVRILNDHFTKLMGESAVIWPENRSLDVCDLCRLALPYREVGVFSMDACCMYALGRRNSQMHTPTNDINLTIDLANECRKRLGLEGSFSELYNSIYESARFDEFAWGKYKGRKFADVFATDRGYIAWLSKNAKNNKPLMKRIYEEMNKEVEND